MMAGARRFGVYILEVGVLVNLVCCMCRVTKFRARLQRWKKDGARGQRVTANFSV